MGATEEPELYRLWLDTNGKRWDFASTDPRGWLRHFEAARRRFAYAVPTNAVLDALVGYGPYVEIGAGTGYWAWLLGERGCDVVPYDRVVAGDAVGWAYCDVDHPFTTVLRGGPEMAARHGDRALLLCWPPYDTPMAAEALRAYGGDMVVYVGEGRGGATGDDDFHERLDREWDVIATLDIPRWEGLHDLVWIYRRRR